MTLMLLTGVTGPLLDRFFLGGGLERRQIVSTKAVCQVFGHFAKLLYFGGIVTQAGAVDPVLAGLAIAASVIGTTVSRYVLEAMSDQQYRVWANRLIASIGGYYILYGTYLLVLGLAFRHLEPGRHRMTDTLQPLILDLVEWIAHEPRPYAEVMDAWRTSCPRLPVWEDAVDRGLVARTAAPGRGAIVIATALGRQFLEAHGRPA